MNSSHFVSSAGQCLVLSNLSTLNVCFCMFCRKSSAVVFFTASSMSPDNSSSSTKWHQKASRLQFSILIIERKPFKNFNCHLFLKQAFQGLASIASLSRSHKIVHIEVIVAPLQLNIVHMWLITMNIVKFDITLIPGLVKYRMKKIRFSTFDQSLCHSSSSELGSQVKLFNCEWHRSAPQRSYRKFCSQKSETFKHFLSTQTVKFNRR